MEHMGTINGVIVLITGISRAKSACTCWVHVESWSLKGRLRCQMLGNFQTKWRFSLYIENGPYIVDLLMKIVIFHGNLLAYQ